MQFINEFNDDITANLNKSDITQEEVEKNKKYTQIKSEFQTVSAQKDTNLQKLKNQVDDL
jgi:predicted GTPase